MAYFARAKVRFTGEVLVESMVTPSLKRDLIVGDSISLPIALFVLCLVLRSLRLVVLPIVSIAMGTFVSFLVMLPIAKATIVSIVAPNLMMCITTAMSIDYSLFLLSRYREEMKLGVPPPGVLPVVLNTAGRTIAVSTLTLIASCMGILLLPLDLLRSLGISCIVTVFVTMAVNLTLSPALLIAFEGFFSRALRPVSCGCRLGSRLSKGNVYAVLAGGHSGHGNTSTDRDYEAPECENAQDVPMIAYNSVVMGEDGVLADRGEEGDTSDGPDGADDAECRLRKDVMQARQSRWYIFGTKVMCGTTHELWCGGGGGGVGGEEEVGGGRTAPGNL